MLETSFVDKQTGQHGERQVLLSSENLRVWFELRRFGFSVTGYVRAVDDISFQLYQGEAVAVVGESGCGKSSLMKTILGLYRPREGQVIFDGQTVSDMDSRGLDWYRSQVGYIQQDPYGTLPPFMSLQRIMSEPMIIGGVCNK